MSETPTDSEKKQRFFQEIERVFLQLRGSPLLLSPSDWRVATDWYEQGIPLPIVIEALEELFQEQAERTPPKKVPGLRFCGPKVTGLWAERLELGAIRSARPAEGSPSDEQTAQLGTLAAALPENLPDVEGWRMRVRNLAGSRTKLEADLAELEQELLRSLEDALTQTSRIAMEARLETAVAPWREGLSEADLRRLSDRLRRNLLREEFDLPHLTLL